MLVKDEEADWTGEAEITKAELLAVGEHSKLYSDPLQDFLEPLIGQTKIFSRGV